MDQAIHTLMREELQLLGLELEGDKTALFGRLCKSFQKVRATQSPRVNHTEVAGAGAGTEEVREPEPKATKEVRVTSSKKRKAALLIIACDSPQEPSQVRLERISTLTAFAQESISELAQASKGVPIEGVPRGEGDILCLTLFIV